MRSGQPNASKAVSSYGKSARPWPAHGHVELAELAATLLSASSDSPTACASAMRTREAHPLLSWQNLDATRAGNLSTSNRVSATNFVRRIGSMEESVGWCPSTTSAVGWTRWRGAMLATFTVNRPLACVFALAALVVPLLLARQFIGKRPPAGGPVVEARRSGLGALVIGTDGRASTSKVQAVLWTFAVFFAIAFMLVWGRSVGCGDAKDKGSAVCVEATKARSAFDDFVNRGLQAEYFVLLGFPLGVAVAAKAITQAQVDDGLDKPPLEDPNAKGLRQSLREIASNDVGEFDLLDFQYLAFNLLTLTFFFVQFLTHPADGLPDLPPTLIALSGLAAATYTTKKALSGATIDPEQAAPDGAEVAASDGTPR